MQLQSIIAGMFDEMLQRKELGRKWSVTKEHIAEIVFIRTKSRPTAREIAKAVKKLPYRFLMKTGSGYCFPANAKEWAEYTQWRQRQAQGLLRDAIEECGYDYNDFKTSLTIQ